MASGPQHSEGVARLACIGVKVNEGGETGGVNAFHFAEIERHVFADDRGRQFLKETLLLPSDQLLEPQNDSPC